MSSLLGQTLPCNDCEKTKKRNFMHHRVDVYSHRDPQTGKLSLRTIDTVKAQERGWMRSRWHQCLVLEFEVEESMWLTDEQAIVRGEPEVRQEDSTAPSADLQIHFAVPANAVMVVAMDKVVDRLFFLEILKRVFTIVPGH